MEKIYQSISTEEAKKIITEKSQDKNFVILDVRTREEFLSGAIQNAINLDFYSPDFCEKLDELDKNKTYLIYCRSGARSKGVLTLMQKLGFEFVYELDRGISNL